MGSSFTGIRSKLNIPVGLITYAHNTGIRKPFSCYLSLQFLFAGKIHEDHLFEASLRFDLGIRDSRTFRKYISKLVQHQFLVYNPKSGYYFIRGFERLRTIHGIKDRTSVLLYRHQLSDIQAFIDTALIGQVIQNQEYYWVKGKERFRRAALTMKDNANTLVVVDPTTRPPYFGLSNVRIADKLNCSLSQACKRKHKAETAGLLQTTAHYKHYHTLPKADYQIRSHVYKSYPTLINRLRFRKVKNPNTGLNEVELVQQLHDEIKPLITFSKRKRIPLIEVNKD